ncbi:precorrin-2 dehydrogenase/sirohydrochlorin ferrochelatase family protein [Natrarchaeobaculum aegyptiacum]|uniref:precorrin-2 dehydrogenase n=1 Tax=Natrarchaeobaculum aegyptiacum TaxID=745377 RepID=A0A2Z2HT04_9EURY|nr:bifunctional precorrin-2 dehydrogenase/sirohydrochlorin ferrochelatase [Natrarchaeobaculum aegyptiacum]ARS90346.1 siroheme synthase [Natrarchaeobaculum aegyptiacum]
MIPLVHDFTDARVLVFGGGPVGARKARRFAREADVIVLSPAFADRDFGDASLVRVAPDSEEVTEWIDRLEPALVVAATDDEAINDAVETAAREQHCLVNRADRSGSRDPGSVVVPATVRDDPVVVSISTGGQAPALSKHLRRELEDTLEGAGAMASVCSELRAELAERGVDPERRRAILADVASSPDHWTALRIATPKTSQVIEDVLGDQFATGGDGA